MLQNYKILTISHQNVKTEDVVYFDLTQGDKSQTEPLRHWMEKADVEELLLLSTCNRVTYLVYSTNSLDHLQDSLLSLLPSQPWDQEVIQMYEGIDAVEHLFKVGASMDSLVIGEREIFRQLKEAYEHSLEHELSGDHLRILNKSLVKASKRIYTESKIGEKSVSVVSLAMQLFSEQQIPKEEKIMILGAGSTVELISKFVHKLGYSNVDIYNRSLEKAEKIANEYNWQSFESSNLGKNKTPYSAIITCTAANNPQITSQTIKDLGLENKPLVIVDLAVPQDVSEEVSNMPDVTYIEISDLKELAAKNLNFRAKELAKAEAILKEELVEFEGLVHRRFVERAFSGIPSAIQEVKDKAIDEVFADDLAKMDTQSREVVMKMMDYMAKKCIALPMKTAKEQYLKLKDEMSSQLSEKKNS